jgi:broad specificity phosphatase PhoE
MKIIFVRHGESIGNEKNIIQGHSCCGLSKKGIKQAELVAKRLSHIKFDIIFSSDILRAKQTAQIIYKYNKKTPIRFSKLLRERNFGCLEKKDGNKYSLKRYDKRRPKGGETYSEVKKRASDFLDNLVNNYNKKTIVVVAHGGFIRMMYSVVSKKSIKASFREIPHGSMVNTCIFEIELVSIKSFGIIKLNCAKHLEKL